MKHFQIVVKGVATNKITLFETNDYNTYRKEVRQFKNDCNLIQIITTNIYEIY